MKSKYYQQENQKKESSNREESIFSDIKINMKPFEDIDILENSKNIQSAKKQNSPFKGVIRKLHSDKKIEKSEKKYDVSNFNIKSPQIPLYPKNNFNNNLSNLTKNYFQQLQKSSSQHNFMHDSLTFVNKSIDLNSSNIIKKKPNFQQTNQSYLNAMKALQDKIKNLEQQIIQIKQDSESQIILLNHTKNLEIDEQKDIFDKLEQSLLSKIKTLEKKFNETNLINSEQNQIEKDLQEKFHRLQSSTNQRISSMDQNLNMLEQKLESQLNINQHLKNQILQNNENFENKEDGLIQNYKQLDKLNQQYKQNNNELNQQNTILQEQIQSQKLLHTQEIEMIHKKYSDEISSLRNDIEKIEFNLQSQVRMNNHDLNLKDSQIHDLIEKIDKLCYDNEQIGESLQQSNSKLNDIHLENQQQRQKISTLLEKFIKIIDNLDNQEQLLEYLTSIKKDEYFIKNSQNFDVQINRIQLNLSQLQKNDIFLQNIIELEQQIVDLNQQLQNNQLTKTQRQQIQNLIVQKSHQLFQLKQDQEQ